MRVKISGNAHNWKRASFTIEAAYIIPISAIMIALLIAFTYYAHEITRSKAVAYEAGIEGTFRTTEDTAEQRVNEVIEYEQETEPLGVSWKNMTASVNDTDIKVKYSESVLPETFGTLFKAENEIKIDMTHPVKVKRLEWIVKYAD